MSTRAQPGDMITLLSAGPGSWRAGGWRGGIAPAGYMHVHLYETPWMSRKNKLPDIFIEPARLGQLWLVMDVLPLDHLSWGQWLRIHSQLGQGWIGLRDDEYEVRK